MGAHAVRSLIVATALLATMVVSPSASAQCTGWPVTCIGVPHGGMSLPGGGAGAAIGIFGLGLQLLIDQSMQQPTLPQQPPDASSVVITNPAARDPDLIAPAERTRVLNELRPLGAGSYVATESAATTTDSLVDQLRPIGSDGGSVAALDALKPLGAEQPGGPGDSPNSTSAADQLCDAAGQGAGCIGIFKSHGTQPTGSGTKPQDVTTSQSRQATGAANCGKIVGFSTPTPGSPVSFDCAATADALQRVVPLLRASEEMQKGWPLDRGSAATRCDVLRRDLDATIGMARRGVLAANVYDIYEPGQENALAPAAFARLSSPELSKLCGANTQTFDALTHPVGSSYRAAIYRDKTDPKKLFIAFRGTTSNLADWLSANVPQAMGFGSDYYSQGITLARILSKCASENGLELEIVGHSLGGGIAAAAGAVNRIKTAAFNPAGVHHATLPSGTDIKSASQYVTDYVVRSEPLNLRQDNPGIAKAERYYYLLPAAPVAYAGAVARDLAVTATDEIAGRQVVGSPDAYKAVQTLYAADMPAAIGRRVVLEPDAGDVSSLDPFARHEMRGVIHAIVNRWNATYHEYRNSCLR